MKINFFVSKIALIAIVFFSTQNVFAESKKDDAKNQQSKPVQKESTVTAEDLFKISKDDMVIGNSKAKVTIIEYASMTCSHCADFQKNTYPEVKEKYIDTGKVKYVFRAFPLDEPALRASMLAYCSGPEKFHKFIDVIFSTQPNWALSKNYLEVLANIGKLGGVTGEEFDKCMANKALEEKIMQSKFDATTVLSVRSTPSFFINGVLYKGAHKFEFFSKVIDEALSEKSKDTAAEAPKAKATAKEAAPAKESASVKQTTPAVEKGKQP